MIKRPEKNDRENTQINKFIEDNISEFVYNNIGETGNIRQLPMGSSKLKRFFDNSETFSSKSIIYYSVNILFDTLTDKDSSLFINKSKTTSIIESGKKIEIYEVKTNINNVQKNKEKDSYPIEFAAKLLMYNLLKANEFEKEKEEEEKSQIKEKIEKNSRNNKKTKKGNYY